MPNGFFFNFQSFYPLGCNFTVSSWKIPIPYYISLLILRSVALFMQWPRILIYILYNIRYVDTALQFVATLVNSNITTVTGCIAKIYLLIMEIAVKLNFIIISWKIVIHFQCDVFYTIQNIYDGCYSTYLYASILRLCGFLIFSSLTFYVKVASLFCKIVLWYLKSTHCLCPTCLRCIECVELTVSK